MSKVSVEIGASTKEFDAVVASLPAKMNSANQKMAQQASRSGSRMNGIGSASMQMQDIAVQLQMGTKMSTIIAQQGSQMLSVFGPTGMIIGGLVAVSGMLVTMKSHSSDAITALGKEIQDFDANLAKIKGGGMSDMLRGMEEMTKRANEAREAIGKFSSDRFFAKTTYKDGVASNALDAANESIVTANERGRLEIEKQLVITAEKQAVLAQLRADGLDEEAAKMMHNLKLAQLWQDIDSREWATPEGKAAYTKAMENALAADKQLAESVAESKRKTGGGMFGAAMGGFANFVNVNADAFKQQLLSSIGDQIAKNRSNTASFTDAAFSPLRGEADISTGRGRNVNPLMQGASRQISEMTRQTNLLQKHADSLTTSNKHLASIDKIVAKLKTTPVYN